MRRLTVYIYWYRKVYFWASYLCVPVTHFFAFAHRSLKAAPPPAERFSAPFTVGRQESEPSVFFFLLHLARRVTQEDAEGEEGEEEAEEKAELTRWLR